jgi:hypothetical protein
VMVSHEQSHETSMGSIKGIGFDYLSSDQLKMYYLYIFSNFVQHTSCYSLLTP